MSTLAKIALGVVAGLVLGLFIISKGEILDQGLERPRRDISTFPGKGSPAMDFRLRTLDGTDLGLEDFRGKAVLLNFWATWCGPCTLEMPIFNRYAQDFKDDLTVLGVNMQESTSVVQEFIHSNGIQYPILLDEQAEVARRYQVTGLPTTYVIDQHGMILAVHVGYMSEAQLVDYLGELGLLP